MNYPISTRLQSRTIYWLSALLIILSSCQPLNRYSHIESEELDNYDGPDMAARFEFERTKDPATGRVPRDKFMLALKKTLDVKADAMANGEESFGAGWVERGPTSDVVGGSNGNTRANSGKTAGRIRSMLVDLADGTGNTVWLGGVSGGIWKTTDITVSSPTWTLATDFLSNMAITGICQDPTNTNTMYSCTGEAFFNLDAVAGDGVFKSTDHGVTWAQLPSTTGPNFDYCTKILIDALGNVYVTTRSGVYRSPDGGTWTDITPTGLTRFSDMEISNTGRLHVSAGIFSTTAYRYTDVPAIVAPGTWISPTSGYPSSAGGRIELGCNGTTLYALPADGSYQIPTIYKSTDGGANWAATAGQPTGGWATGQAWYALAVDIDGSGNVIVGGLDPYKSTNGGTTWTKLADWTNNPGLPPATTEYVHADIHSIIMYGSNRVLFGCDGGIHYSSNGGTTIRDRNDGLRIKQYYSCAIHPSTTNYFLAGAQDNGVHQYNNAGLSTTVEVTGGDGGYVAIDQDQPSYQFGSYVYNNFRKSTNGGSTWSSVGFGSTGLFINPWDYDNTNNIIYASYSNTQYLRWNDPQTGSSASFISVSLNSNRISAVTVSPYTSHQVYMGTDDHNSGAWGGTSRLMKLTSANTASPTVTSIKDAGMPVSGVVSCINTGTDDNNLIMCFSNYGVASVWVSTNNGTSWTSLDNNGVNLPDMPVRWCMFYPGDNTKAILATETGIWETSLINGTSTVWIANTSFPTVRTDMIKYRPSDGTLAAATHGRGLWTNTINSQLTANYRSKASGNYGSASSWEFNTYGSTYIDAGAPPTSNNNVTIQSGHTITLDASQTIGSGKSLTINGTLNAGTNAISGAGAFTLSAGGTLATSNTGANGISQNITVSGTKTFTDGSNYTFNGATTAPFGSHFTTVRPNNLVIGANVTLDKSTYVTGALGFSGSSRTLTTGSNLTIGSSISGTARIADLTKDFFSATVISGNSISGTATVERYIANPGHRSWHLLGAKAVTGSQTIYQSWQENGATGGSLPNYGTWITSNLHNGSNGFDASSISASILTYNQGGAGGPSFNYSLANTNSTVLSANQGYMLFVRGDRNYTPTLPTPTATNATTLRTNGTVTQGTQAAVVVSATGTGRTLVANPYASPIDFESIQGTANLNQTFYIWDPTLTGNYGVGGYVLVDRNGGSYQVTPVVLGGTSSSPNSRYIHSGAAIFLKATGTDANVIFTESAKTASVSAYNPFVNTPGDQQLIVNLMIVHPGENASLADGLRLRFDKAYKYSESDDEEKMGNFAENISSYREGRKWIIEKRPLIKAGDTIYLRTSGLGIKKYQLQLGTLDFIQPEVKAWLVDRYLGFSKPIDLSGAIQTIEFSVTSDPGSSAPDRFIIVFQNDQKITQADPGIRVFPSPVTGNRLSVRFNDMEKGSYEMRLFSNSGQLLSVKQLIHTGGSATLQVDIGPANRSGQYRLVFIKPDGLKMERAIVVIR